MKDVWLGGRVEERRYDGRGGIGYRGCVEMEKGRVTVGRRRVRIYLSGRELT